MALEMKVYKDIHAYEAKAWAGLTWRQLAAIALGGTLAFVLFFFITWLYLINNGWQFQGLGALVTATDEEAALIEEATTVALIPTTIFFLPFAVYGWVRPKGLKPERFIPYWFAYQVQPKELCYGHDSGHRPARTHADGGTGMGADPGARRGRGPKTRKKQKAPTEH